MSEHMVSLSLTARSEVDWSAAFSLLADVAMAHKDSFKAISLSSHDLDDIPEVEEEPVAFTENTMMKVYDAIKNAGVSEDQTTDIINSLRHEGILFREILK